MIEALHSMTPLGVALSIVLVLSAAVLLWQWWTGMLADPFEKPLRDGRDQWNSRR